MTTLRLTALTLGISLLAGVAAAFAQAPASPADPLKDLAAGVAEAKNTVTILAKNFIVFAVSSLAFLVLGFGLMFGDGNPLFGTQGLWFVATSAPAPPATACSTGAGSVFSPPRSSGSWPSACSSSSCPRSRGAS